MRRRRRKKKKKRENSDANTARRNGFQHPRSRRASTTILTFTAWTLAAAVAVTSSASAFTPTASSFVASRNNAMSTTTATLSFGGNLPHTPSTSLRGISTALSMSYTVGIVGATGAVGKEIRTCLETRNFPVSKLRIFGSERSAGNQIETEKYGDVTVELFDVKKARECDVVFLAVSGDFALEHAKAITEGDDGAVCIDNSVSL
eukprot:scaffold15108_cov180-Amphora_coffeaeformis.AAC.19